MNFKIKKDILLKQLNHVIKGISSKNLKPILNCIKFELNEKGLYLLSTDNDITIKAFIDKNELAGEFDYGQLVVSGKYIYEIIKKFPNDIITIEEVVDSKIFISTTTEVNNCNTSLICNNLDEFPNLDLELSKTPIIINSKMLKNLVSQTSFAASAQSSRPTITGINVQISDNKLTFRATDSYRLAQKTIEIDQSIQEEVNIIIPTKNIIEVTKMLDDDEENVELHIFSNKIVMVYSNLVIMSKLIEGSYPDVSKLIPTSFKEKITVATSEFYSLIDRAALFSTTEDNKSVRLECSDNILTANSNIPEIGTSEEKLFLKSNNHEYFKIAFSSLYMMDAIKVFDCEEIELLYNEEIKPIIIKAKDEDTLIQLVVPMKSY